MDNLRKNRNIIIVCISLILILLLIFIFVNNKDEFIGDKNDYRVYDKKIEHYDANEIIPVYVTQEDMVKKYLNEYKNNIIFDREEAYKSLNDEYKEKKFGSFAEYSNYIDGIFGVNIYSMELDRYSVTSINGKKVFSCYDKSGYQYIFKENSIMNYEVYLDDFTVEIK